MDLRRRRVREQRAVRWLWAACLVALAITVVAGGRTLLDAQPPPALTVSKTGLLTVPVGGGQTFLITVSNPNAFLVADVAVTDPVPAAFTVVSAGGTGWTCTFAPGTATTPVTCVRPPGDVLPPGGSFPPIVITATAKIAGSSVNTATAVGTYAPGLPIAGVGTFVTTITQGGLTPTPPGLVTATPTLPPLVTATATATGTPIATVTATVTATAITPPPGGGTIGTPFPTPTPLVILLPPRVQPPPTAAATATPTATATPVRTASPTGTPTPATAAPSPTATPTIAPTALPTAVTATAPPTLPTPTPTAPPPALQIQGAYGPLNFIAGANPLRVGQTTRIRVTYTVRNTGQEPLNFTGTCIFEAGVDFKTITTAETLGTSQIVPAGTGGSTREQVIWTDFILPPGGSATITAELEATPPAAAAGRALIVFESARITARGTTTGRPVERTEGPLLTSAPGNLAAGGIVQPASPAAPPAQQPAGRAKPAAQAPAAPARPIAQAPAGGAPVAQPPVRAAAPSGITPAALPRSGVGAAADHQPSALLVAAGGLGVLVLLAFRRRVRSRKAG